MTDGFRDDVVCWRWRGEWLKTVEDAEKYVSHVARRGFTQFHTATSRLPRRHPELVGGSVFFVRRGEALFRMPFIGIEDDPEKAARYQGRYVILMEPTLIRVASTPRVGFVRGWRYLKADDAPADADAWETDRKVLSLYGHALYV